jgi:hypothetical protein
VTGPSDALVETAAKAIEQWASPVNQARAALAAVLPMVHEQIAAEIEAARADHFREYGNEENGPRNYDWAMTHAARIARGGAS